MAAHLHRYGSELHSLSDTIQDIKLYNRDFHETFVTAGARAENALAYNMTALDQLSSHLSTIITFRDELRQKIDNVLVLVCVPVRED